MIIRITWRGVQRNSGVRAPGLQCLLLPRLGGGQHAEQIGHLPGGGGGSVLALRQGLFEMEVAAF